MDKEKHLQDLSHIKDMMNKSSRFFSLSGLSGILAGVYALIGAGIAYSYFKELNLESIPLNNSNTHIIISILLAVGALSTVTSTLMSRKNARKSGESLWNHTSRRLLFNFVFPLLVGALFILINLFTSSYGHTSSLMLIFYGLALINASKFTYGDIKYLGLVEIVLGLLCSIFPEMSFWFWVIGFGVMHIIYGSLLYFKHERN